MEAAEDEAGDDREREPGDDVEGRDPVAEEAVEEHDRDLVHERARDQERERHAERHPGRDEADEGRHGAAGAERRRDPERGGGDVADALALAAEQLPGPLQRDEAAQDAHDEDDPDQQQQDLGRVVEEEVERLDPARIGGQPQNRVQKTQFQNGSSQW